MNETPQERELSQPFVHARLTFLVKTGEKPVNIPSIAGGEPERNTGLADERNVLVHNARRTDEEFALDRHGFMLVPQLSRVSDFYDDDEIAAVHDPEVVAVIKQHTGADSVVIFDHTRRSDDVELMRSKRTRDPSRTVHNDYTTRSAPQRVRDLLAEEADAKLEGRFAIVNLWRTAAGVVRRAPLALCDARTVESDDLITTERRARNRIGETYCLAFNENQRWYYFPRLARDEALLIKTYDSEEDGRARFAPHASFDNPYAGPGTAPRESIETRAFVFY